jgi:hypothetical protein
VWESTHLIVFYLEGWEIKNMRTSNLIEFGIGALIVILMFLAPSRPRKPRFKPPREPTEAEVTARRQKSWEAYLKERAGGHKMPAADQHPQRFIPPDR